MPFNTITIPRKKESKKIKKWFGEEEKNENTKSIIANTKEESRTVYILLIEAIVLIFSYAGSKSNKSDLYHRYCFCMIGMIRFIYVLFL